MTKSLLGSREVGPLFLCLLQTLICASPTSAQHGKCSRDVQVPSGYKIGLVKVDGRWVPPLSELKMEGSLVPSFKNLGLDQMANQPFSLEMISEAQMAIANYLVKQENQSIEREFGFAGTRDRGAASSFIADYCLIVDETLPLVDIVMKPKYIRVDLYRVGANTLPVPRSVLPTFYDHVPRPLLAFNPTFGMDHDPKQGLSPSIAIATNLIDLPRLLKGEAVSAGSIRLGLRANGRKSFRGPFYSSNISLALARQKSGQLLEDIGLDGSYAAYQQPLGEGRYLRNSVEFGGHLRLRPGQVVFDSISLSGNYRLSANRSKSFDGTAPLRTSENAFVGRALIDGQVSGGFSRLAVWVDLASSKISKGSYRRLGTFGYEKEFGSTNQTVGLEALLGTGRAWGHAPEYARFFGGNSAKNFLYEAADSSAITDFPVGPLIRSLGESQAGGKAGAKTVRGGTSFWGFNLNVAIPVPRLTRPLIPSVNFTNSDGTITTLKEKLKNVTINTTISTMEGTLEDQIVQDLIDKGMSPDEAQMQGERIATEKATEMVNKAFKPAIYFIADKANLISLKPLVMLDIGRIGFSDNLINQNRSRVAAGGGLQFTVIIARFEAGYMHTFRGNEGDRHGNLVMRLVFQNLF